MWDGVYIQENSDENVILLGGTFQKHSRATVRPMTKECVRPFRVDKIFVGIDEQARERMPRAGIRVTVV
ncbi:DeoR family transcriptional regulator [Centipeda periodontii DSM 2778]|uniref:DeoR family transcriptional regulator n=1 Tax=Centipeda periodontii DSM 2778 TaxID=888060 RepID=F5RLI4_9FIRM|nr:DeoR family transcriptional regulator [Centipeda periodontii DSM 2778]